MKTKTIIILIIVLIFISNYNRVFASFADFTDDDAKKTTQQMVNEQKQNFDATKSNNNYLKNLRVKGYDLTPAFDKQTLEYYLNIPSNVKEITIEASVDNDNAKVEGAGVIQIKENQKDYRVDVTAESGTVRSYFIKINYSNKKDESNFEETQIETSEVVKMFDSDNSNNTANASINEKRNNNEKVNITFLVIIGVILIISIFVIVKLRNKPKARRRR